VLRGEIFWFTGPNGAGETATLRILTGRVVTKTCPKSYCWSGTLRREPPRENGGMTYPGVSDSEQTDRRAAAVAGDVVRALVTGQVIHGMWDDRSSASQVVIAASGLLAAALYVSQGILPYFIRDVWLEIAGTMSAVPYLEFPATIITATKWAVVVLYTLATLTFVGIPEIVGLLPMRHIWRQGR
jgi:hypothetical protein